MFYSKQTLIILHLMLSTLLCSDALGTAFQQTPQDTINNHIKNEITWLELLNNKDNQTDIRLKIASSPLFITLVLWDAHGELLFPDVDASTHFNDYSFSRYHHRMENLMKTADPIAWERNDVTSGSLLFCHRRDTPVCLLIDTDELTSSIPLSKQEIILALFPPVNKPASNTHYSILFITSVIMGGIFFTVRRIRKKTISLDADNTRTMGDMIIDARTMTITRDKLTSPINPRDLKILICFCEHPDEIITKDALYNTGWGRDFMPNSRALEQHIVNLRKKIDPERNRTILIETVHGQGYRYPESRL